MHIIDYLKITTMKKRYIAPASQTVDVMTSEMLALSTQSGSGNTVTEDNKDHFEQYSNRKGSEWNSSLWSN